MHECLVNLNKSLLPHSELRASGAEPSATFFQILMAGEHEEVLDGTQMAADWTFSGLQKFGQAFIDRLRGKRLPSPILQKVLRGTFERHFPTLCTTLVLKIKKTDWNIGRPIL